MDRQWGKFIEWSAAPCVAVSALPNRQSRQPLRLIDEPLLQIGFQTHFRLHDIQITPGIKDLNQCHSGECQNPGKQPGCRIKSGMTSVPYFIARLILPKWASVFYRVITEIGTQKLTVMEIFVSFSQITIPIKCAPGIAFQRLWFCLQIITSEAKY